MRTFLRARTGQDASTPVNVPDPDSGREARATAGLGGYSGCGRLPAGCAGERRSRLWRGNSVPDAKSATQAGKACSRTAKGGSQRIGASELVSARISVTECGYSSDVATTLLGTGVATYVLLERVGAEMASLVGVREDGLRVEWAGARVVVGDSRVEEWPSSDRAFDRVATLFGDELAWLADAEEKKH